MAKDRNYRGPYRPSGREYDDYDGDRYEDDYQDGYEDDYQDGYGEEQNYEDEYEDGTGAGQQDGYDGGYYDDGSGQDQYGGYDDGSYQDENGGYYGEEPYEEDQYYEEAPYEEEQPRPVRKKKKSGRKKKKGGNRKRIILLVAEVAVLLVAVGILYMVTRVEKAGKMNLPKEELEQNMSQEAIQSTENGAMKGYRNIAFFGVDSTEGQLDQNTRSDTIMICSINQETGDVKLISVYRDTLLNLSSDSDDYNKCNAAYARGGPEQAINMLNRNLDLNITDFVTVGFGGLTDVVNALGGIEINVDQDEIVHLNNYQSTMAQELGMDYTEVTQPGLQTLDGLQATAYCRIRYTRGWDYKRAARQREVLYAVARKAQHASPAALAEIVNNVFSEIYTSMDVSDMVSDISAIANYNIVAEDDTDSMQNGFPNADLRIQANLGNALGDCVVPENLSDNVIWLHQFLFGDDSYQVSNEVSQISDHIAEMTKDAVPEEMTDADHT